MGARRVSLGTKLAYGFGSVAFGVKDNGFAFFLLLYYNQVLGLPQRWVGFGIMVALVLDAVSDPIVGYLSDNLHSRWGRRHPFMYASALPVAVSYFFLWNPPSALSGGALFAYFLCMAVLVRTFITFYEIPSAALVAELSPDYDQRTSMISFRFFFGWWGGLTIAVLAYSIFLQPNEVHAVGVLNPGGYRTYGFVASIIMAAAILISSLGTHRHIPHLKQPPPPQPLTVRRALREVRETLLHRSFVTLFAAAFFGSMAAGLSAALNIYFNTYFWELTSDQITVLVIAYFPAALAALFMTPRLSARLDKKPAAIVVSLLAITLSPVPIVLRLLGWFPANGSPALLPMLLLFGIVEVTLLISSSILVSSMVADVVEDSEISTGRRSEGVFFAARSFVQKAVSGVGIFLSAVLLSVIDFPANARPGEIDASIIDRLGRVYAPALVILYLISLAFLSAYRISRASHEENLRRLGEAQA
jgi:glycoside/pentoside/hexuronide:cation symporter, GPH family